MIYFLYLYALCKLYIILNIYQQSHYALKEYSNYFIKNIIFYDLSVILCGILGMYTQHFEILLCSGFFVLIYSIFYFSIKVKLTFSHRIIRLYILSTIYILLIGLIPYIGGYILILIEFSLLPLFFIEKNISKKLNNKYILSAKNKLKVFTGKKIMITGSYGKTSTKLLFNQLLNAYESSVTTPKSYNTPLGISKFINDTCIEVYSNIILEYGASKRKDIEELCNIAQPDIGVVTEVGYMHMNGFKTIENVLKEKMKLLINCKIAIINYENPYIRNYKLNNPVLLTYGFDFGDFRAKNIQHGSFDFYYRDEFILHFDTNLVGKHQILNLLAPLSYLYYMKYDLTKICKVVSMLKLENSRLQLKKYDKAILLDDSFNSNLKGFIAALKELNEYPFKKILITPGIVELGKYEKEIYEELAPHIVKNTDIVILVGYEEGRLLYNILSTYSIELYIVNSFKEGYKLYNKIIQKMDYSAVLIENDLPDIYKRGLRF